MGHTDNVNNADIDKGMYGGKLHAMSMRQFLYKGRDRDSIFSHVMSSAFAMASNLIAKKERQERRAELRWHTWLLYGRTMPSRDQDYYSQDYAEPHLRI